MDLKKDDRLVVAGLRTQETAFCPFALAPAVVSLCEAVFDLAYTAGHEVGKGAIMAPDDSRDTFSLVMKLASDFEASFADDGSYLDRIDTCVQEQLLPQLKAMSKEDVVAPATYVSVWDNGVSIESSCKVNLRTREVFDIGTVDAGEVEILEAEFIRMPDGEEFDVFCEDDAKPETAFWHK